MTVICAEAPIALYVAPWGISPLTPCCCAAATGTEWGICCKGCYEDVDPMFGSCWEVGDESGWATYRVLLAGVGVDADRTDRLVEFAKQRAGEVIAGA